MTTRDGLRANSASSLQRDHDGNLWFISGGEIHRYDGSQMTAWSARIGFPTGDLCKVLRRDSHGVMWIVSEQNKIFRFDGRTLTNVFTAARQAVSDLHLDSDRTVWFGIMGGGLFHHNGASLVEYDSDDGLPLASNHKLVRTQDGQLWVGLRFWNQRAGGLFRFDSERFTEIAHPFGLGNHVVSAVGALVHGGLWAATDFGMLRYDGHKFQRFTTADGLAHDHAIAGFVSSDGRLWCGTQAGVSQYDGIAWASLDSRDGLTGVSVNSITEDDERDIWFATEAGLSRYRRNPAPPIARITAVLTDQTYTDLRTLPAFTAGTRITFSFDSIDAKTVAEKRQYRCRIGKGTQIADDLDPGPDSPEHRNWLSPNKQSQFEWTPRAGGTYTFAVQAIDRDLMYSEPAVLVFTIVPMWYLSGEFVGLLGGGLFAVCVFSTVRYVRSRRRRVAVCASAAP